ncbi:DUF6881 domain-containing protein [Actinoplanes rectilineatus]|uniref:DUF6881 domain-containing protein n=1 Tax=Actinoplanes rectilineatus TaxID=113571 RepID=UPI0014701ED3|nr:hypothetical protein [Actinoplanes rectilineatus]
MWDGDFDVREVVAHLPAGVVSLDDFRWGDRVAGDGRLEEIRAALERLGDDDPAVVDAALGRLRAATKSEGNTGVFGVGVVPELLRSAAVRSGHRRAEMLQLVGDLARMDTLRLELRAEMLAVTRPEEVWDSWGYRDSWNAEAVRTVLGRYTGLLATLLDDHDAGVRGRAAYVLVSAVPVERGREALLRARLTVESDDTVRMILALCIAQHRAGQGDTAGAIAWSRSLWSAEAVAAGVRLGGAVAELCLTVGRAPAALLTFVDGVATEPAVEEMVRSLPWIWWVAYRERGIVGWWRDLLRGAATGIELIGLGWGTAEPVVLRDVWCLMRLHALLDALGSPLCGPVEETVRGLLGPDGVADDVLISLDEFEEAVGHLQEYDRPDYFQSVIAGIAVNAAGAAPARMSVAVTVPEWAAGIWEALDRLVRHTDLIADWADRERADQEDDQSALADAARDPAAITSRFAAVASSAELMTRRLAGVVRALGWQSTGACHELCAWPVCEPAAENCVRHRLFQPQQTLAARLRRRHGAEPQPWYLTVHHLGARSSGDPFETAVEVGADGYERRKVVGFRGGRKVRVDRDHPARDGVVLRAEPVPSWAELTNDPATVAEEVCADIFALRWAPDDHPLSATW